MVSVSPNAVALDLNVLLASALQDVLLETTILATKAIVLSLRMIGEVSAWNAPRHDERITNGGFPFPELYVVRKVEPENKDASETEDDNEDDDDSSKDEDEDGEDEDDVSADENEKEDPEDGPDANGDGGSDEEDEDDGDEENEDDEDDEEDGYEEEDDDELPQPPPKKRK